MLLINGGEKPEPSGSAVSRRAGYSPELAFPSIGRQVDSIGAGQDWLRCEQRI